MFWEGGLTDPKLGRPSHPTPLHQAPEEAPEDAPDHHVAILRRVEEELRDHIPQSFNADQSAFSLCLLPPNGFCVCEREKV